AIGFTPVASHMYTDTSITLGYANTEGQITRFNSAPLLSVVAPLERNPQMIMWDPDTYPDVESIADLGERDITISVFGPEVFSEVFIAQGIWSAGQVDPSYDGSPANFIASQGSIAQQGFASAEPFNYRNTYEDWGKDVKYQLLHDAGFPVYSQTLAIRSDDKVSLDACLRDLVPIIQRAVINFSSNPDNTNALIVDVVESFNSFWVYGEEIADYSVKTQSELGLVGNGTNDVVGDMDQNRVQEVIHLMDEAGIDTNEIGPSDIFTNEYIDESIGFD
ncbi:MAG: nitrate ABC transporter substrate-binding protein, partial [Acidimicrobiaceae bacterium]|nr:nitrate ABC transporter substrate-binding protein [Acidimicrobiaceae bacterium]